MGERARPVEVKNSKLKVSTQSTPVVKPELGGVELELERPDVLLALLERLLGEGVQALLPFSLVVFRRLPDQAVDEVLFQDQRYLCFRRSGGGCGAGGRGNETGVVGVSRRWCSAPYRGQDTQYDLVFGDACIVSPTGVVFPSLAEEKSRIGMLVEVSLVTWRTPTYLDTILHSLRAPERLRCSTLGRCSEGKRNETHREGERAWM